MATIRDFMEALEAIVAVGGGDQEAFALVIPQSSIEALDNLLNKASGIERIAADGEGQIASLSLSRMDGTGTISLVVAENARPRCDAAQGGQALQ